MKSAKLITAAAVLLAAVPALAEALPTGPNGDAALLKSAADAQRQLQQTFTNLKFEDFGPSPIKGPIFQAMAGGRLLYFAPESEHLLFAAIYDRHGQNLTAQNEESAARSKLGRIDPDQALAIGPAGAPTVIEFTDPDCPYCRSLHRFWATKEAEGKPVRRLIYFVTGIHPEAAAKAEHILCSPDREVAFRAIYAGAAPSSLATCAEGRRQVEAQTAIVGSASIQGTPTLIAGDKVIAGFKQAELESFLDGQAALSAVPPAIGAQH